MWLCLGEQEAANLEKAEAQKRAADKAAAMALPPPIKLTSLQSLKKFAKESIVIVVNMERAIANEPRVEGNVSPQCLPAQLHACLPMRLSQSPESCTKPACTVYLQLSVSLGCARLGCKRLLQVEKEGRKFTHSWQPIRLDGWKCSRLLVPSTETT